MPTAVLCCRGRKKDGSWKPIAENDFPAFLNLLTDAMAMVPPWVRVNRVQRDFPEAQERNNFLGFVSDNIRSNLQQMVYANLEKRGLSCYDIRNREVCVYVCVCVQFN